MARKTSRRKVNTTPCPHTKSQLSLLKSLLEPAALANQKKKSQETRRVGRVSYIYLVNARELDYFARENIRSCRPKHPRPLRYLAHGVKAGDEETLLIVHFSGTAWNSSSANYFHQRHPRIVSTPTEFCASVARTARYLRVVERPDFVTSTCCVYKLALRKDENENSVIVA